MRFNRREFVKLSAMAGAGLSVPSWVRRAAAAQARVGLSDPALQPKFVNTVANALAVRRLEMARFTWAGASFRQTGSISAASEEKDAVAGSPRRSDCHTAV